MAMPLSDSVGCLIDTKVDVEAVHLDTTSATHPLTVYMTQPKAGRHQAHMSQAFIRQAQVSRLGKETISSQTDTLTAIQSMAYSAEDPSRSRHRVAKSLILKVYLTLLRT